MELLEGETLGARLCRQRFTRSEAIEVIRQIAAGLDACHRHGIIHLDLKPSNILLTPGECASTRVVLTDFGLSHNFAESDARNEAAFGTRGYLAPEQMENREVSTATDIYALGVVIYEMLAGERPDANPLPIESGWDATIRRCLAVRPGDRFAHALDVVSALEEAGARTAESAAAAIRSTRRASRPQRIPAPLTSLIGRAEVIDNIGKLLRRDVPRLITLVGSPGVGKTRVSLEAASPRILDEVLEPRLYGRRSKANQRVSTTQT
ncbi:MAG: protein kinase [Acidobacteria bacterium]|nr:protein kinase [Acidobacteriota bacterium]